MTSNQNYTELIVGGKTYRVNLDKPARVVQVLSEDELVQTGSFEFEPEVGTEDMLYGGIRYGRPVPRELVTKVAALLRERKFEKVSVSA